jgi:Cytochrome P460
MMALCNRSSRLPKIMFLTVCALFFSSFAQANDEMNGLRLKDYAGFEKNWSLVTVRFRKDTNEQRFVYANPIAMKDLTSGAKIYSDGAVFAKIGMAAADDPDFPSSAQPFLMQRIQLMVKDSKKYKKTDGWGYALFLPTVGQSKESSETTITACHACHQIVKQKNFVFSSAMNLNSNSDEFRSSPSFSIPKDPSKDPSKEQKPKPTSKTSVSYDKNFTFKTVPRAQWHHALIEQLPPDLEEIRFLQGEITKKIFSGTINEVIPLLAQESLHSNLPAGIISKDGKLFTVVFKGSRRNNCKGTDLVPMTALSTIAPGADKKTFGAMQIPICSPKVQ